MIDPLNKLCKWRSVLAGWHAGTQSMQSTGVQAMRDLMDKWLVMRTESSALAALLIRKNVFTAEEFTDQVHREAAELDRAMERVFPGFRTVEHGVEIYDLDHAQETMRRLGFPP
jgi:hypothetical protein